MNDKTNHFNNIKQYYIIFAVKIYDMSYKIKSIDDVNKDHHLKKYPWESMNIGDFIEPENPNGAIVSARFYSKKHCKGVKKFILRKGKIIRIV